MIKLIKYLFSKKSFAYFYSLDYTVDITTGIYHKWDSTLTVCHINTNNAMYLSEYDLTLASDLKPCKYCIR